MEAAVRSYLHTMLADYVTGLNNTEISLPLTLRNLQLKADAVNKEMEDVPFNLTDGRIGFVSLKPNTNAMGMYNGTFEVTCTDIKLNLEYSMSKMMKNMMGGGAEEDGSGYYEPSMPGSPQNRRQMQPMPPPENVPPCYCREHDTSAKRQKDPRGPQSCSCEVCNVEFQTTYIGARLCQYCSSKQARCIICGQGGAAASGYIPATKAGGHAERNGPNDRGPGDRNGPNDRDNFGGYGSRARGPAGGGDRRGPDENLPPPPPPAPGQGGFDRRDGPGPGSQSMRYGQDGGREQGPNRQDYGRGPQNGPGDSPDYGRGPGGGGYGGPPPGQNPTSFRGQDMSYGGPPPGQNPQGPGNQGGQNSFNPQPPTSFSQRGLTAPQGGANETRWNPGPGQAGPPRARNVQGAADDDDDDTFVGFLKGIFDFRGGSCSKPNAVDHRSVDVYHDDPGYGGGPPARAGQGGYR